MEMNGGFLVTKIKQLGDRIFEKILSEKNIDAFNAKNQGFFFSAISILSNFCLEILAILKSMLLKSQLLSDENKTAI